MDGSYPSDSTQGVAGGRGSIGIAFYAVLVTATFLIFGLLFGLWHPAWLLFLTIPIYAMWSRQADSRQGATKLAVACAILAALATGFFALRWLADVADQSWSMSGCSFRTYGHHGAKRDEAGSDDENTITRSVDAASVKNLSLDWQHGSATVRVADDKEMDGKILISETSSVGWHDVPHMAYEVDDETLKIYYGGRANVLASCSSSVFNGKELTVTLPKSCAEQLGDVELEGAAGDYAMYDLTCQQLRVDLGAGFFRAKGIAAQDLDVDVSSGNVEFDGKVASSLKLDVSSGDGKVRCRTAPQQVDLDVSSGDIELLLPRKTGFTARVDVGSGDFACDFATEKRGDRLVAGDGAMRLSVDVGSGNAHVGKR